MLRPARPAASARSTPSSSGRAHPSRTSRCGARSRSTTQRRWRRVRSVPPRHGTSSRAWSRASASQLADRVAFHSWLQWIAEEQVAAAQAAAHDSGMRIGLMHDLAVGVHTKGSDAWSLRDMYAAGITVGAPPDMYNQQGQDWSQPPWLPEALRARGVSAAARHDPQPPAPRRRSARRPHHRLLPAVVDSRPVWVRTPARTSATTTRR